ncbi:MAG: response regulator receiver protein [Acidobacteria bacterium]|nr:response regulator receiver protein [Acidobacteriota bacterium]
MPAIPATRPPVAAFDRHFFDGSERFTSIGGGEFGGKAHSLLGVRDLLAASLEPRHLRHFDVCVPTLTVIATDLFEKFMAANRLWALVESGAPDHRLATAFQAADLPVELVGDLWALVGQVRTPLAIRSSSLLEDALGQPFAGVYATKMIPNNQQDVETRFHRLVEAVKLVYASTFFESARNYRRTAAPGAADRMAVIIQAIVGRRHRDRFYPELSGVARSFSFYRSGRARPEDGVVNLALGLGKTIVDGGITWSYSPAYPQATPPYGSIGELMKQTQVSFWAVNMGRVPSYDPVAETEYLVRCGLEDAEEDETLRYLASTYDARSDRLSMGVGIRGPRALTFSPLLSLEEFPLNDLLRSLLRVCAEALAAPVEIEFAATFPPGPGDGRVQFGFLQVRPMAVSSAVVEIDLSAVPPGELLLASERVMGNGVVSDVRDVVYVRPERFEARQTPAIAEELARVNRRLADAGRPYLLIGFGRWGSSDPWLGVPVEWSQINGARSIVEATLPAMNVDPSQGSHFFHNLSSFDVSYFTVPFGREPGIDWDGLARRPAEHETPLVRHVRLDEPLLIEVDGRRGVGAVRWGRPAR